MSAPAQWRFVAVRPGTKAPIEPDWPNHAVPAAVVPWNLIPEIGNIGVCLGASGLIEVDDDGGLTAWLAALGRELPPTHTVRTALRGTLKRLYDAPPGLVLTKVVPAPGVELRAGNHQCVYPPSVIGGRAYQLVDGRDAVPAPDWLVAVMTTTAPPATNGSVGMVKAASVAIRQWHRLHDDVVTGVRHFEAHGWGEAGNEACQKWTRELVQLSPDTAEDDMDRWFREAGTEPDEHVCSLLADGLAKFPADVVVPDEQLGEQESFWAGGRSDLPKDEPPRADPAAADPAGGGAPFAFRDPGELDQPYEPPRARWGAFGGAEPLFYAGGVHWVQGESESGKTWVALALLVEVLEAGEQAIMVDFEDAWPEVLGRLRSLGIAAEALGRLVYLDGHAVEHADLVAHLAGTDRDYALMVLDGVTSALTSARLSGRDEQELTAWADAVPRRARMTVCVDHVVKNPDERNGMAIGTQAKKSVVTGSSFEVRCREKFGRGSSGSVELRLQKDKRGGVRALRRSSFRVTVRCGLDGSVRLLAAGASSTGAQGGQEAYFGATLPAEVEQKIAERVAVLEKDQRSNPSQSMRVLVARLRDLGFGAEDKTVLRPAVRRFLAGGGVPVNVEPEDE